MKKRSERMRRVCWLTEAEEAALCRTMGEAQQRLDHDVARLEELQAYRASYRDRPQPRRINSRQWQDYQNFLQRLDQAIALQTEVVMNGKHNREAHRRRWLAKRRKLESLERVVSRFSAAESVEDERALQKATDEQARGRPWRLPESA